MAHPGKRIHILLVEDNPGDIRLTREAFSQTRTPIDLRVATDGVEALDFLRGAGQFRSAPRPDLILLDLNLPRKNGREVLAEIKQDQTLRRIPVVVLTTSTAEEDILGAYDLHANSYITKPVDLGQFDEIVQTIERFWLSIARLPSG
ncbi:MAG TPA: response regulator [bacterium]|jgi:CheY-like chemotaxis protein